MGKEAEQVLESEASAASAEDGVDDAAVVDAEADDALSSGEKQYRRCCGAAWRRRWEGKRVEYCEASPYLARGLASSFR